MDVKRYLITCRRREEENRKKKWVGNTKEKSSLFTSAVNLSEKARVNSQLIGLSNVLQFLGSIFHIVFVLLIRVNRRYHSTRSASQLQWCFGSTQFCWRPQAHCLLPRRAPPQWVCTCPSPRPPTHQLRGALSVTHPYSTIYWLTLEIFPNITCSVPDLSLSGATDYQQASPGELKRRDFLQW